MSKSAALVDYQQILQDSISIDFPVIHGIYFLIQRGQIVYVGQSLNCHSRVRMHLADKEFDRYTVVSVGANDDLNTLEALHILKFRPIYNRSLPSTPALISPTWFRQNKVPRYRLRRLVAEGELEALPFQGVTYYWRTEIESALARGLL